MHLTNLQSVMNTLPLLQFSFTKKSADVDVQKRLGEGLEAPSSKRTFTSEEEDFIRQNGHYPYILASASAALRANRKLMFGDGTRRQNK